MLVPEPKMPPTGVPIFFGLPAAAAVPAVESIDPRTTSVRSVDRPCASSAARSLAVVACCLCAEACCFAAFLASLFALIPLKALMPIIIDENATMLDPFNVRCFYLSVSKPLVSGL
jgi:hypothetical protein